MSVESPSDILSSLVVRISAFLLAVQAGCVAPFAMSGAFDQHVHVPWPPEVMSVAILSWHGLFPIAFGLITTLLYFMACAILDNLDTEAWIWPAFSGSYLLVLPLTPQWLAAFWGLVFCWTLWRIVPAMRKALLLI